MEDEHLCVDNLVERLYVSGQGIPTPGASMGELDL
jgi:hypothetical protein